MSHDDDPQSSPRTRMIHGWRGIPGWRTLFLVAAIPAFSGCDAEPEESEPPQLSATIAHRTLGDFVSASGTLRPSRQVDVGAQVSGQLEKLHVRAGDTVSEGDLLAEIDATIQRSLVEASRATLDAQETQLDVQVSALELARLEAARQERLMQEDATHQAALDRARDALVRAEGAMTQLRSNIESQRARLSTAEANLGYSKIFAPIDGTVLAVLAAEGQTLTATYATPLILRIADLSTLTVEARVPEANVRKLNPGMPVRFTTLGGQGRAWRSALDQILPVSEINEGIVTYTALFNVDNSDGALLAGMTVQVFFEQTAQREVLAVPLEMVTDFGERDPMSGTPARVHLRHPDGRVEVRAITIGEVSHTHAEVLSGLSEGDSVVTAR